MSQDFGTQPSKPCIMLPVNTSCVNPLAVQGVLTPLKASKHNHPRFAISPYQKCNLCMRVHKDPCAAHTFHAQPLTCTPARWMLLQCPDTEPAPRPCLALMPPLACYTWHPRDTCKLQQMATPKGILQSIPLTFLFSNVLSLHWDHCPLYWMLRKNYRYLIHEAWAVVQLFSIPWISLSLSDSNTTFISPFSPATSQGELAT